MGYGVCFSSILAGRGRPTADLASELRTTERMNDIAAIATEIMINPHHLKINISLALHLYFSSSHFIHDRSDCHSSRDGAWT